MQAAGRAFWRVAPLLMGACVGVAALARWRGGSAVLPLAMLAGGALLLLAGLVYMRRPHAVPDAVAARLDEAAAAGGEIRSASWFAVRERRDPWTDFHLERAALRLRTADWTALYPAHSAARPVAVTVVLALCLAALVLGPQRDSAGAGTPAPSLREPGAASAEDLLPELQRQLEALLAAAEAGTGAPTGTPATAAQLRDLIGRLAALRDAGRLKDLARAMSPSPGDRSGEPAGDLKAIADRARNAARMPGVAPEARETLEKLAEMTDSARASQLRAEEAGEPVSSAETRQSAAAPGTKEGEVDEASIQSVSEAETGGGAGVIMMGSEDDASGKVAPGLGLGGGSNARTDSGRMADLDAALRRETVEASADAPGQSVETDVRRKTEHGEATVTYARSAAATFDRGRAVAPPAVPESRRTAVQTYFIRKP